MQKIEKKNINMDYLMTRIKLYYPTKTKKKNHHFASKLKFRNNRKNVSI